MKKILPFVVFAFVVVFAGALEFMPSPVVENPPPAALSEVEGFTSVSLEPSPAEVSTLPSDTVILKRRYQGSGVEAYLVTAVIGGRGKSSIHRPELCLPAQGYLMSEPHNLEAGGIPWRALRLSRGPEEASSSFAYTFFNQAGLQTSSHIRRIFTDVWDRSILGRIDRWVMVTVVSLSGGEAAFEGFLSRLAPSLLQTH